MRKERELSKLRKETIETIKQCDDCIRCGITGYFQEEKDAAINRYVEAGGDVGDLRIEEVEEHYLTRADIKKELRNDEDWVIYKGLKVHKYYDAIKDGNTLISYRRVRGMNRKDFIAEAIEHNSRYVENRFPSYGSGEVYHIMEREDFREGLVDYLYESPLNLKRVDSEGYILYIGLEGRKICIRRFSNARQASDYLNLNPSYIRQVLRGERPKIKNGYLIKTFSDEFREETMTEEEYDSIISDNIKEMESRGWLV